MIEPSVSGALASPDEVGIMGIMPGQNVTFSVTVNGGGEIIFNNTGFDITDLHFEVMAPDFFGDADTDADTATGSSAFFSKITLSADKRTIWFEDGVIANGLRFRVEFLGNAADTDKVLEVTAHYTIPEPSAFVLAGAGLLGLVFARGRVKSRAVRRFTGPLS